MKSEETFIDNYLTSTTKQFEYYKSLGEKTFDQLSEEQLFFKPNDQSNSIAIIVNHLSGNMLSRWTEFLTSDGEKDFRNRDQEFENVIKTKEDMIKKWNKGWTCLFDALNQINNQNFDQIVYIRNIGHTITEAINRQSGHYAYHIGQIVYLGKSLSNEWISLSIPKGKSHNYNQKKFSTEKHKGHFTDEFLK